MISSSRADKSRCAALTKSPRSASSASSSSARSDSAHGNASSYVTSDIGPTPPAMWQCPQRFTKIARTSSLYVDLDGRALSASLVVEDPLRAGTIAITGAVVVRNVSLHRDYLDSGH